MPTTNTERPTRWGILATGGIARAFAKDLAMLPNASARAVASRTKESARRFADQHDIPTAYGSWAELAADPDIDVVYVATPHAAHLAATRLMLEAGKPVLCEKPLTISLKQARELVDLARERGVFLMEAMWMLTLPLMRRIIELVDEGAIGEIRTLYADFNTLMPSDAPSRLFNLADGGGALLDLGVYPVSLAQRLLGTPTRVSAFGQLNDDGIDTNTGFLLGHDNGATALLSCSMVAEGPHRAEIGGTKGRVEIPGGFFHPSSFVLHRQGHESEEIMATLGPEHGFIHEAIEVARCLRAGETESPLVPLDHTLAVMATLDAAREQLGLRYPNE